ncbi:MAG: T9SS type A sorting domain-containing protein [Bacteroidetes bacterium]|nr:T9SS type A sorting domain-containing protein [Bacteroidota bacterium]
MKTTITKKIIALVCAIIISATGFAQTKKTEQQKQDEQGAALKQWFDSGEIIIDGTVEDAKNNSSNDDYLICNMVKINQILKGDLNKGYINILSSGHIFQSPNELIDPPSEGGGERLSKGEHYLIKIKKVDLTGNRFLVNNNGTYVITGFTKKITSENGQSIYQMLHTYCGVQVDKSLLQKKSLNTSKLNPNPNPKRALEIENIIRKRAQSNQPLNIAGCSELFISEYLCGQGNNKAIEIYNPTSAAINLANYSLLIYHGSSYTPTTIALTGTISALSTHVVSKPNASAAILAHTNQTSNNLNFNGDECIVLNKAAIHIDKIGEIGVAIGSGGWTLTPSGSTNNSDLRRKYYNTVGDTIWANCKSEWNVFVKDSVSNLGQHQNYCSVDPDVTLSLTNVQTTGTSPQYFEFDVTIKGSNNLTYLEHMPIELSYNAAAFGDTIYGSGNVVVTNGSSFTSPNYQPASAYDRGMNLLKAYVIIDLSNTVNLVNITTSPIQLMHVKMQIADCHTAPNVQLVGLDTTKNLAWYYNQSTTNFQNDPQYAYDNAYGATTNISGTACTGPQITSITPNSVIAGAYYSGISPNEAQLTINGTNFGTSIGKVFMKNAFQGNQSTPAYIQLDNYDLTWSDNQIVINVPSVLFAANPNPDGYPGTGYVKVLPASGTDTASSQILGSNGIVKIPYCLKNALGGTIKRRVGFAYQHVIDSIGHADTAAYIFRFDPVTITNNSNPLCRPLLKQAIKDWACHIPIRYRIGQDTTIANGYTIQDGISYVTFDNTMTSSSAVAETKSRTITCGTNFFSSEADIHFLTNPTKPWYFVPVDSVPTGYNTGSFIYGKNDFFSVALHELGHASLLFHVNDSTDLMYWAFYSGDIRPYISTNDYDGAYDNLAWSKTLSFSGSCTYSPFTIPSSGSGGCADPTNGQVGIQQFSDNTQLSIYPNPAANYINVTFSKKTESSNTIKLIDALGQTVFCSNIGKNEGAQEVINVAGFSKGIYILIVTDNNNTLTQKIIIE